jgi:tRNA (adenine-N(1)-)-methyltransferase non-catalytic subunit
VSFCNQAALHDWGLTQFCRLVSLGKYGAFHANQILGRPFHLTFEILDRSEVIDGRELRVVPAAELHADALIDQSETPGLREDGATPNTNSEGVTEEMSVDTRTNKHIIDDPTVQKLTMAEIEALKHDETGSSKELIAKILQSHSALDQKTAFSLAKYTLRKNRKYLKRFCVLPLDVVTLADWMMKERDFGKVMEIRNEILGLVGCWANVHSAGIARTELSTPPGSGHYLVVDDTGGLIIAALAERMGVLHPSESTASSVEEGTPPPGHEQSGDATPDQHRPPRPYPEDRAMSATSNTITLIHANSQPNLALLRYFGFDASTPSPSHPLYMHLQTLSWLQLLDPAADPLYAEPENVSQEVLSTWKSSKRSTYFRKRRRWERTKSVIDSTRSGGFNGLVIASFTNPVSILHHAVPLLAGAAQVVVYAPHIEPLAQLADCYSTARRTAFINTPVETRKVPSNDFPLDPRLLLAPMVQTARVRRWQVLPGRTHPLMMGRGGAEGYVFVGTRVLPAEGRVEARGKIGKKRKIDVEREGDGGAPEESVHDETTGADGNREAMVKDVLPSLPPSTA